MKKSVKYSIVIILILLSVGFAVVATNLIVNNNSSVAFSGDFEVIFSNAKTTGGRAYITDNGRTLNYKAAPLTEVGSQTSVTYDVTNNSANYDANLDISITDDNGNPISSDYFTIEETVKLPSTIEARSTVSGTLTITKTKSNNEEIHSFFKITINANPVERNTLGDGEYFAYIPSASGLYDEKNNLLADWDTLVNEYGLDLSKSCDLNLLLKKGFESATNRVLFDITGMTMEELQSKYGDSLDDEQIFIDYPELEKFKNNEYAFLEYMDFEYPDKSMLGSIIKENKELQNAYRLVIDDSVTELSPGSLAMNNGIKEIVVPGTVTKINQAFAYNVSIEKVVFEEGLGSIPPYTFIVASKLKSIVIPSTVKEISSYAFMQCTNLSNIENNSDEFKLIDGVLYDKNLTSIILYPGAKQDEVYDIPDGIKSIEEDTLSNNYIRTINIPSSVVNISPYAFDNTNKLESINVDANNSNYESVDDVLIDKKEKELLIYPINKKNIDYVIPEGITSIHYSCFDSDTPIENITIPASVTDIGNFYELKHIKNINLSQDNKSFVLENNALFDINKTKLYKYISNEATTLYSIPNTVTSIEPNAFYGSNLTRVVIPNSTNRISYDTFRNCKNLSSAHFENSNGWNANGEALNSDDLSDDAIAAKYLTKDYVDESWSRK
ncbi:MAG: leucine-rich repeat domain-containing protein [Bacilli bacterium]|nr:leucine-rich repeat domain-containing protein [Bacilli bacterium]